MTRLIALCALAVLAACAGPAPDLSKTGGAMEDASVMSEPMIEPAPVAAAPVSPAEICDSGDGIGGTGCPVE